MLRLLHPDLAAKGYDLARMPPVFQHNKRDAPDAMPIAEMNAALNPGGRPQFESIAKTGLDVHEPFRACLERVYAEY